MKAHAIGKLQTVARQIQKKVASKALILMYHRIAEVDIDPWGLAVTPQNFAEHLEVLQKYAHPIDLPQLAQAHRDGNIPHRSVAITFDDGYADNLDRAKPLLEKYRIPATVFVSTGYLGTQREFWWDELARILLAPSQLPPRLSLSIDGNPIEWELGAAAAYSDGEYCNNRFCKAWTAQPGSRMFFYYSIWQVLLNVSAAARERNIAEIATWAGDESLSSSTDLPLTIDRLIKLASGDLVEIGAHTITHPFLSSRSIAEQQAEIQQSKAVLERILARPVANFSYPFGNRSAQTIELVKASGFKCACSTQADVVWRQSDGFDLPRVTVENWDGSKFNRQLSMWFD